jgi:hypothetical protein
VAAGKQEGEREDNGACVFQSGEHGRIALSANFSVGGDYITGLGLGGWSKVRSHFSRVLSCVPCFVQFETIGEVLRSKPILSRQLHWMRGPDGAVSTAKVISGTVFVASPAYTFRILRMNGESLFQHLVLLSLILPRVSARVP